jgi:hypothetical protein
MKDGFTNHLIQPEADMERLLKNQQLIMKVLEHLLIDDGDPVYGTMRTDLGNKLVIAQDLTRYVLERQFPERPK